ncbi:hypothetical protein H2204_001776 [Knufia peltigerae]|uniref:Zn(2)-C6 fungal-type domain-containing protein n=1 Tax=Knufia peltigerae TaxID=1002370 RepID=A0AA38YD69_9EURO|nr:hypothetical protein H2204_001776 [Knufia peltigerae]
MSVTVCAPSPPGPVSQRRNLAGKRTNSLGWAKTDCHTCAEKQRICDRRRPKCSACLEDGGICGGYIQALNWERGTLRLGTSKFKSAAQRKSSPEETSPTPSQSQSQPPLPQPSAFVFVDQTQSSEKPRKKARKNSKSSMSVATPLDRSARSSVSSTWNSVGPASPSTPWSLTKSTTPLSTTYESHSDAVLSLSPRVSRPPVEDALAFFHSRFSKTTLTWDVPVNPWQAALPQIHDDVPCVLYAAIALAQRQQAHLCNRAEGLGVLNLKAKALSVFATHLNDLSFESAISTTLLLIALDYAESGVSNWTIHLRGALNVLESSGGIRVAESRQNLRSQIAMLLWYDVTAAMLSRYPPIFPRRYLESLMSWQRETEWSMLGLNGLPDGMFLDMYDLAIAAAHPDAISAEAITAFEVRILGAFPGDRENRLLDAMSRVWKLGLLLYCQRVLVPFVRDGVDLPTTRSTTVDPESPSPPAAVMAFGIGGSRQSPRQLALEILGIVADLPPDSNFQKQCLLPIILASVEVPNPYLPYRRVAIDYCVRWKERTGMWIFDSALEFMSGVWSRNDTTKKEKMIPDGSAAGGDDVDDHDDDDTRNIVMGEHEAVITVPWTDIYPRGLEYGFLFG